MSRGSAGVALLVERADTGQLGLAAEPPPNCVRHQHDQEPDHVTDVQDDVQSPGGPSYIGIDANKVANEPTANQANDQHSNEVFDGLMSLAFADRY